MRPILALLLAVAIIGGMKLFLAATGDKNVQRNQPVVVEAIGDFELDVQLTFDAGPDPFSVVTNDDDPAPSLIIEHQGKTVLKKTGAVPAGEILHPKVSGIVAGVNEFYIAATPQDSGSLVPGAIRVRVIRDGVPIGKSWIDAEPGERIEGVVKINVPGQIDVDHKEAENKGEEEQAQAGSSSDLTE